MASAAGKTYFDAANIESVAQKSYGLWSGRATYFGANERWSVFLYGTNLADKYYHVLGLETFGLAYIRPGAPRELGAGFTANFGR